MCLREGFSCIYPPEHTRPTAKCFGLQMWFTLTQKALFVHGFFPLIHSPKCVMVHCVQSILMVLVFSPKLPESFLSPLTFEVQIFWTWSTENKILYPAESKILNIFDYLLQAPRWKKKTGISFWFSLTLSCVLLCHESSITPFGWREHVFFLSVTRRNC